VLAKTAKQPIQPSSKLATPNPKSSAPQPNHFTNLQRAIGNQGVLHLLGLDDSSQSARSMAAAPQPILQTKLTVHQAGDVYEQEADRVADQIMRTPEPKAADSKTIARAIGQPAHRGAIDAPASVHEVLRSPGQPLDAATRAFMESRFGQDFSRVRIHTDSAAADSASEIHARAYAAGQNIVFASNQFSPSSTEGGKLLAHELTHVAQQNSGSTVVQRQPSNEDEEKQAEYKAFLDLPQIEKDRAMSTFSGATTATAPAPKPAERQAVPGCHSDRYAHPGSQAACPSHHKTEDEATATTRKHLNDPQSPLLADLAKAERAKLDRLNQAYLTFKRTGAYTHRVEFSPYEVETGNIHSLAERWNTGMEAHKIDPTDLTAVEFDERYFVSKKEFRDELRRRILQIPFDKRFSHAVSNVFRHSTDSTISVGKMDANDIFQSGSFVEEEKSLVYERQGQIRDKAEEERAAKARQIRVDAEIQHEMQWEAQGDAVLNQGMNVFIQPLAMAPLGVVGAAMGGVQTGEMAGDAYNACVKGQGDCTSELIQVGAAAATHTAFKMAGRGGDPMAPVVEDVAPPELPPGQASALRVEAEAAAAKAEAKAPTATQRPTTTAHASDGSVEIHEVKPPASVESKPSTTSVSSKATQPAKVVGQRRYVPPPPPRPKVANQAAEQPPEQPPATPARPHALPKGTYPEGHSGNETPTLVKPDRVTARPTGPRSIADEDALSQRGMREAIAYRRGDQHHIFPQETELQNWFNERFKGQEDIHEYTVTLGEGEHGAIHQTAQGAMVKGVQEPDLVGWNQEWKNFKKAYPRATPQQIFEEAGRLMEKYHISEAPISRYGQR
jgi:hypothetical protein